MKKLKIKKRMSSFLMLAVMVVSIISLIPKTDAFAKVEYSGGQITRSSHFNHSYSFKDPNGTDTKVTYNLGTVDSNYLYLIEFAYNDYSDYVFASYGDFSGTVTYESDDDSSSRSISSTAVDCSKYGRIYITSPYTDIPSKFPHLKYKMSQLNELRDSGKLDLCGGENMYAHFCAKVCNYKGRYSGDMETIVECGDGIPDGTADNPYEDKEIGHLILTGQKGQDVLPENRDTDAVSSYQVFKWKSKTDTGFSLTKNKYAQTRIEAKVESRCVIYKHMNSYYAKNNFTSKKIEEDNEVKEKFKNFGESASISKVIPADSLEYVLSFDKIDELLPKTAKEWHNDLYVGHNYRVYFRVLCTDSLTVIPDENDNSWHSGGWSYVDFSLDGVVSGNGDGHFDENGEWVTDDKKDDINNGGRDTFVDDDAAKDDRNNSSDWGRKDTNSDSGLDTSSIKGFMNQVGNVPKAIGKLFTFLPDWVTTFIAFGFVLLIALMIIKAIRG